MQSKAEYIYHEMKKKRPIGVSLLEKQWEEMNAPTPAPSTERKLIDWTKPLKCHGNWVKSVTYTGCWVTVNNKVYYVCDIVRASGDYNYLMLYDEYGNAAGNNAQTARIYNEQTSWNKSAWMVLDRFGGHVSSKHKTRQAAYIDTVRWHGESDAAKYQYIRYDYVEST